ncbi:MAG: transporter substrate-binding domain-containing protein [Clostridia bacterium]|nr:transporter substrate-binding domain-containing protein [Clostridia bacterium]
MKKILALVLVAMFAISGFAMAAEKLTMATNVAFPPYEFYDDTTGEPTGIDVEIAKAICAKLGYEMEVVDIDFGAIVPAVQAGKYDFAAAGMTVTDERKQMVDFTDTYAIGIQVVIVPEDSTYESIYDIVEANGSVKIAVQQDTTGDIYTSDEFEAAGTGTVERFKSGADAVLALTSGKVDCVVIDNEPAKNFVAVNEGLKILASAYTEEEYAMAFPKKSEIYEAFNAALAELIADGTVANIINTFIPAE